MRFEDPSHLKTVINRMVHRFMKDYRVHSRRSYVLRFFFKHNEPLRALCLTS